MAITLSLPTPFATLKEEEAQFAGQGQLTAQELEEATWQSVEDMILDVISELDNDQVVEASGFDWNEVAEFVAQRGGRRVSCQDEYDYIEDAVIDSIREELTSGSPELNAEGFVVFEVC